MIDESFFSKNLVKNARSWLEHLNKKKFLNQILPGIKMMPKKNEISSDLKKIKFNEPIKNLRLKCQTFSSHYSPFSAVPQGKLDKKEAIIYPIDEEIDSPYIKNGKFLFAPKRAYDDTSLKRLDLDHKISLPEQLSTTQQTGGNRLCGFIESNTKTTKVAPKAVPKIHENKKPAKKKDNVSIRRLISVILLSLFLYFSYQYSSLSPVIVMIIVCFLLYSVNDKRIS